MKKKLVPVLVVLALIAVGIGAFFLGREFAVPPSLETPPAQSSTPEVTPEPAPAEPTPAAKPMEPEKEPVVTESPEVSQTPEPSVEPDPVAAPEPAPEVTPEVTPEPAPETKPEPAPVPDDTQRPTGPDESNKQEEQAQKEAQQSASSKFTYPANSTTEGLTSFEINSGMYINKNDGKIYDQYGDCYGTAPGYDNGHTYTEEDNKAASENNKANADKIYDGDGSGSDTSGWGN